jgi:hypothetical protein
MKIKDSVGKKFNKMAVLNIIGNRRVKCKCECGTVKDCDWYDLKKEKIKGCGCQRNTPEIKENLKKNAYKLIKNGILNRGGDRWPKKDREFKYLLRKIQSNSRRKNCSLTIDDLKEVWINQKGICPYTKIQLKLPVSSSNPNPDISYMMASVDRIDSSKPYIKDNIQFVSRNINYAKNTLTHDQMFEFVNLIIESWRWGDSNSRPNNLG